LVGNIPYYITGKLLRTIGELPRPPEVTVLTVQREVALRVAAEPPRMNLLAAAVQAWSAPQLIASLPPEAFSPPPQVHSAVIALHRRPAAELRALPEGYYRAIRTLFKQPRKTVFNNLRAGLPDKPAEELRRILSAQNLTGAERPGTLSRELLIKIAGRL
jgi:16S rRNA (adenine1518-N6/adenine1519-N6)-dimethyltransferase